MWKKIVRIPQRFLWWFAVTDVEIAENPRLTVRARMMQTVLGTSVLLTGCFALLSGGYASYITFDSVEVSVVIGLIYAFFIVTIDRMIVGSSNRWTAIPRLLLAIAIGLVIAVPVEVRFAQDRIEEALAEEARQTNAQIQRGVESRSQIQTLRSQISGLQAERESYLQEARDAGQKAQCELVGSALPGCTGRPGQGPAYENAKERERIAREQAASLGDEIASLRAQLSTEQRQVNERMSVEEVDSDTDFVGYYEKLHELKQSSTPIFYASWGIKVLFMLIEVTPAFLKIFMDKTSYNESVLDNEEVSKRKFRVYFNKEIQSIGSGGSNGQAGHGLPTRTPPPRQRPKSSP